MASDVERSVATLLRETEAAHGDYEMNDLGERDQDWPIWYATYLFDNGLADLLPTIGLADVSTLAGVLAALQEEYERETPGVPWTEFDGPKGFDLVLPPPAEGSAEASSRPPSGRGYRQTRRLVASD